MRVTRAAWRAALTRRSDRRARGERGQAIVELSVLLPVFLMMLFGMLEFGLAFDHLLSIDYATREGARVGAALVNGGGQLGCASGQSPNAATVDPQIIAAVERVLTSQGSLAAPGNVSRIRIFLATPTGAPTAGSINTWVYLPGGGPVVDGEPLDFAPSSVSWDPCQRSSTLPAQSIGIALDYHYTFSTPLGGIFRMVGGSSVNGLDISDQTVMALNPSG